MYVKNNIASVFLHIGMSKVIMCYMTKKRLYMYVVQLNDQNSSFEILSRFPHISDEAHLYQGMGGHWGRPTLMFIDSLNCRMGRNPDQKVPVSFLLGQEVVHPTPIILIYHQYRSGDMRALVQRYPELSNNPQLPLVHFVKEALHMIFKYTTGTSCVTIWFGSFN